DDHGDAESDAIQRRPGQRARLGRELAFRGGCVGCVPLSSAVSQRFFFSYPALPKGARVAAAAAILTSSGASLQGSRVRTDETWPRRGRRRTVAGAFPRSAHGTIAKLHTSPPGTSGPFRREDAPGTVTSTR